MRGMDNPKIRAIPEMKQLQGHKPAITYHKNPFKMLAGFRAHLSSLPLPGDLSTTFQHVEPLIIIREKSCCYF
jgi:hypothetical protein